MANKITIKQIAKALNVSISTVSKALNDSYEISEETKKRIQEYATKHNYKPNLLALSLQNKKTKNIGVLVPNILNTFFARVLRGIENVATKKGYNIITCITNESYAKEVNTIETLSNGALDGFIACLSEETLMLEKFAHFNNLIKENIPLVLYDRVHKSIKCDKIVIDNIKTAYKATRFLMKLECKNIAFISTINNLNVGKFRVKGYLKALTKYNYIPNKKIIIEQNNDHNIEKKIEKMLQNQKVDGIFTVDEVSAAITLQVLNKKQIKIPEEIMVVGFTNGVLSKYSTPPLTTVNQFGTKIGEKATLRFIDRIENKIPTSTTITDIIKTELVERATTKRRFIKF